ncbi:hypothetical protein [Streptomyces sp. 147326]|uniref:hypothetical protein n=1 Tax=Streptomyces sp. 147326 TaxID=3074379 RepID=UPI003857C4C2
MTQPAPLDPEMFDPVCPSPLVPFRIGDKWAREHWDELLDAQEAALAAAQPQVREQSTSR